MIQRPQTLFFLATIAISILLLFSNLVFFEAENTKTQQRIVIQYNATKMMAADEADQETNTYLIAFIAAVGGISLTAMLMFKNRKTQLLLTSINYVLILGCIAMMYLYSLHMDYFDSKGIQSFEVSAVLPLLLIILNFLASRGINKDMRLIRSMDRLR
jgi:4-amino-4-deoxy-L-arabinose transferase-like glycosyltransferase